MYFAESLTCDNGGICETVAETIMIGAAIAIIVYCVVLALSIQAYRRNTVSRRRWVWRLWFLVLALPAIIFISSLLLP